MAIEPRRQKWNFQYWMLLSSFAPFVIWLGAACLAWHYWKEPWGLIAVFALGWIGGQFVRADGKIDYSLAQWGLGVRSKGKPGEDVLGFYSEPLETGGKLKLLADDAGLLFAEDGAFRIVTVRRDYRVPFEGLIVDPWMKEEKVDALEFRFVPEGQREAVKIVISPWYAGGSMEEAMDSSAKARWAILAISSIRDRHLRSQGAQ